VGEDRSGSVIVVASIVAVEVVLVVGYSRL
jgi:hypothetical protein